MASNHYEVKKKISLIINLEVEVETIHNYHSLNEEGFEKVYDEIRDDLKEEIVHSLNHELRNFDNLVSADWVTLNFSLKNE